MTRKNRAIKFNNDGNVQYKHRQYHDAIALYTKAIELYPDHSAFYGNRAQAYFQVRKYEEVISDSQMACKLDPGFWKGHVRAAKAALKLGDFAAALDHLKLAQQSATGTNSDAASARQVILFEQQRCKEAQEQCDQVTKMFQERRFGDCGDLIDRLEPTVSRNFELRMVLCECHHQRRHYASVIKLANRTKEEFPRLSPEQLQRVNVMEMRAFGAITADRWNLRGRRDKGELRGAASNAVGDPDGDLYELLGVPRSATEAEIAAAFSELALKHHPERQAEFLSSEELEEVTRQYVGITQAFLILGDAELRELYDLGYGADDILADAVDPYVLCCGVVHPQEESEARRIEQRCRKLGFWMCLPAIGAATCVCWLPWCVKVKASDPDDAEEQVQRIVRRQREEMRQEGLRRRQAQHGQAG